MSLNTAAKILVEEAIYLHGIPDVLAAISQFAKTFDTTDKESQIVSNWRVIREITATLSKLPFPDETDEGD